MLKRILASDLILGMYIHEFCRPWVKDPFWINNAESLLQDPVVLERIQKSSLLEIWIATDRGLGPLSPSAGQLTSDKMSVSDVSF